MSMFDIGMDENVVSQEDSLLQELIKHISKHGLSVGDKLPSIRTLAESFGCTQSQVRSTLLRAEALGLITIHPRSGCYVKSLSLGSMLQTFCLIFGSIGTDQMSLVELYDVKTALETAIVKDVALIRTESELLNMKNIIQQQEKAISKEEMISLDEKFHLYLATVSRNTFFYSLLSVILSMLHEARMGFNDYTSNYDEVIADHKQIYEAVKAKDENKAYEFARVHANRRKNRLLSYC